MRKKASYKIEIILIYIVPFLMVLPVLKTEVSSSFGEKSSHYNKPDYKKIYHDIKSITGSEVYLKGSYAYNQKRIVENGLCNNRFPDLVVVPKSTKDVAWIVKISKKYNIPLSVRSGGHSYICANIKPRGIHIDMRGLNKVEHTNRYPFNPPGPALRLGPGQTWERVLSLVPMDRYTYIHGQCTSVGVGGYLLGGGFQATGTTQRLGFGSFNVLQYTMVNADGNIMKISENNITVIEPETGHQRYLEDSHNLFRSLQFAGASYGVTTEFHYRIFKEPELLPVFAIVYIDNDEDLLNFQRATADGRYCLTLYTYHFFTPPNLLSKELIGPTIIRMLFKLLPFLRLHKSRAIANIYIVDNYPVKNQLRTNKEAAYAFLKYYKMKLAVDGKISDAFQGPTGNVYNYQSGYQTSDEIQRLGARPIVSASFWNLTSILSLSKLFMKHPLFGLSNMGSRKAAEAECEFCWFAFTAINSDQINDLSTPIWSKSSFTTANDVKPVDRGNIQADLTCMYKPKINSRCHKVVQRAKTLMQNEAIRNGEKLTQYLNTPSCDSTKPFTQRYWNPENYDMLLRAKKHWDPDNRFNYCQSIGSEDKNCCPSRA